MKGGDRPAALKVVRSNEGKVLMDDVRDAVAVMRQAEDDLLRRRADESEASSRTAILSILLPALIGAVLICIVFLPEPTKSPRSQRAPESWPNSRERLRTTLASIGDAVISTDTEGRITN